MSKEKKREQKHGSEGKLWERGGRGNKIEAGNSGKGERGVKRHIVGEEKG